MGAIAVEDRQYQTYVVTSGDALMEVVPERGGMVTRWQALGQEILYLDAARFSDPNRSVRGGVPLLFPICGNVVDDTYTLDGERYELAQHGFARTQPWQVTGQSAGNTPSLTLTLQSSDETRQSFPFDFQLDFTYTLINTAGGRSLEQRFRHTNLSDRPMPFATGIHPYFAVTDKRLLNIQLPSTAYQFKGDLTVQPFSGFDFDVEEIDYAFINLSDRAATVTDPTRSLKLTVTYDDHYSTLVFWTVKGKDFYCLEPWSSPRNALNSGVHLLSAAPGATVETVVTMTVETA